MSEPFIGEIKMFGGNFAPLQYAFCDGQLIEISQNDALFSLIGTTYGGDGQTTFALPDLRGRIPIHQGPGFRIGTSAGSETVTLTEREIPAHSHSAAADSNSGSANNPQNNIVAATASLNAYTTNAIDNQMGDQTINSTGNSRPHDNVMPYQCVSFIIALYGIYPPRQ